MKLKRFLPPAAALLGGCVGFCLRRWQLAQGFEPTTGLAVPGAPSTLALVVWSLAMALALALLCRGLKSREALAADLEGGQGSTPFLTLVFLGAVLLLVSAGFEAVNAATSAQSGLAGTYLLIRAATTVLPPLRVLLCLGGLFCAGLWGRAVYRAAPGRTESLPLLELCLMTCVWLISDYQTRAADPVVMNYIFDVLAIVATLMGLYYLAGYSFREPHPGRALYFCLLGPYFCLVALADPPQPHDLFRLGFAVLFLTAHALFVLLNPVPRSAGEGENETEAQENG